MLTTLPVETNGAGQAPAVGGRRVGQTLRGPCTEHPGRRMAGSWALKLSSVPRQLGSRSLTADADGGNGVICFSPGTSQPPSKPSPRRTLGGADTEGPSPSGHFPDSLVQAGRRGSPRGEGGLGPGAQAQGWRRRAPSSPVPLLRRLHRAFTARRATHSNVESPSSRLSIPNSTSRDPAPAVHVSLLLSGGTPVFRFTWGWERPRVRDAQAVWLSG